MKKISLILAVGLTLGAGTLALAQKDGARGDRGQKMFDRVDADSDGRITAAEAQAFRDERFRRLDANADGQVTKAEMQDARSKRRAERKERRAERRAQRMAKRFEKTDTNGNGALDRNEFDRMAAARFQRMDANGDGAVTRDEIRSMRGRKRGQ